MKGRNKYDVPRFAVVLLGVISVAAGSTVNNNEDTTSKLLKWSNEKYEISDAEEKLFRYVANGEIADFSAKNEEDNDPNNADNWGPDRVLRASRIAWLCTDKRALQLVTHRGIQIKGARIDEQFDLMFTKVSFPLVFDQCKFKEYINFMYAQIFILSMTGTHTGPIFASGMKVDGPVYFRKGFKVQGEVNIMGAMIGGDFSCTNSQFINKGGNAIHADGLKVDGTVSLSDGFKAEGEVRLPGATVGFNLQCNNGQFINQGGNALNADGLNVGGSVVLSDGFKAEGEVRLIGATIGGNLNCIKGQFINKVEKALSTDGLKVGGSIFLRDGFKAEGEVRLLHSTVGVSLECDNSQFINQGGIALYANGLKVEGSVFLRNGFKSQGEVNLIGATIGGNLNCDNSQFNNKDKRALLADGLKVEGSVFLSNGFKAQGAVSFVGATIDKHFRLGYVYSPEEMTLDLNSAKIGILHDREDSWPGPGRLLLHGLEYAGISNESPRDSKTRIEWLRRQKDFWPQPYEQLAEVLRNSGDDAGAKDVLIAKNKDKAKHTKLTLSQWFWYRLFGPLIGYGYRPWRAMIVALILILIGWRLFKKGYSHGLIMPLSDSAYVEGNIDNLEQSNGSQRISKIYPVFNSLVYSIDVFVPLVELHQVKYWLPNANRAFEPKRKVLAPLYKGRTLLIWFWIETALGWILTTLFLAGLTGLVRT